MKSLFVVIFLTQVSCSGVTSFVVGAAGNIFSDFAVKKFEPHDDCVKPE